MSVQEIQAAIEALPHAEQSELFERLDAYRQQQDFDDWDRQMQADAEAGAFDELIKQAKEEHRTGRTTPLP
ncbi:MAG: hypothetical protein AAGI91_08790 [Bacteroidota bacterium]